MNGFAGDKGFGDRGNYFVYLDGVTLNSRGLVRSFTATDIGSAVAEILDRPSAHDMNPFNYWYKNSPELRAEFARRRTLIGDTLSGHRDLVDDCVRLFDEGSELEKAQAITLATAAKRLGLA